VEAGKERQSEPVRRLESELDQIVKVGLWAPQAPIGLVGKLVVLGAPHKPRSWKPLRSALADFLMKAEDLQGPISEMALLLFGATAETRDQLLEDRERAVGEVVWRGKTVTWEAVRRRTGRRYVILQRVAQALYDAELEARQSHMNPANI
jgi:hypothetical protein